MVRNYVKKLKLKKDVNLMAFPILAVLASQPKTSRELCHALHMDKRSVYVRTKQLEQQGLIVKRFDKRWVPVVGIRMEKRETPMYATEIVGPGEPTGTTLEEMVKPETRQGSTPTLYAPPDPPKVYRPPPPPKNVSANALKVSKHFRVPASLGARGEASIGPLGQCPCGKPTPLKYGGKPLCPLCARGGH